MKLAVSNIAWAPEHAQAIIPELAEHGVEAVVLAPTMVWAELPDHRRAREYARYLASHGLRASGMQSLTFGLKNAALFGEDGERRRLSEHLKRQAALAGALGVSSMVFGSPGLRNEAQTDEFSDDIINFFGGVAHAANDHGTQFAVEPLSGYGNQFITCTDQGIALVKQVNHPGLGLHLDSAAVAGAGEVPLAAVAIADLNVGIASFDAAAPELRLVSEAPQIPHAAFGQALQAVGYEGVVSLEVKGPQAPETIFAELDFVRRQYGI